ncbi:MAG: ATP-binding protein, partial [Elusimicrobiota bacterium]
GAPVESGVRFRNDFFRSNELPDGLYRQHVPVYDEKVVRELLVNALVHRPYTQRGDIFLNFHPDRLQIVNPGVLPLGVTPNNVLHAAVRRNEHLARLFHDLKLMEREGSGFDLMFEIMLAQGRHVPELSEGPDRVEVVIRRRILKAEVIDLIAKADAMFQLSQRERICFGLIAQHDSATARELARVLELPNVDSLRPWLGRLLELKLVGSTGKTQATRYFIPPDLLRKLDFPAATNLKRIEPHRLKALIVEDLQRYPSSSIGAIQDRVGAEVPRSQIKKTLEQLVEEGRVHPSGEKRGRRYRLSH